MDYPNGDDLRRGQNKSTHRGVLLEVFRGKLSNLRIFSNRVLTEPAERLRFEIVEAPQLAPEICDPAEDGPPGQYIEFGTLLLAVAEEIEGSTGRPRPLLLTVPYSRGG
jgi:hypothetical protein